MHIPDDKKLAIIADRTAGMTFTDIKNKYGVGLASAHRICNGPLPEVIGADDFNTLSEENRRLQKAMQYGADKFKQFEQLWIGAARQMPVVKPVKPGARKGHKLQLEFHAIRSDEQAGALVTALDTSGIGGYDLDIYVERLNRWADKIITFKAQDQASLGLNKLVIHRLGDWLEGESIYPGQAFHIDAPIVDVIYNTVLPHEREVMLRLASHFETIEQFCVQGNHGRAGKKGDHHWRTSFEYMTYRTMQLMLENQKNVKTYVSDSIAMLVQHGDFIFCLDHGASLKSSYGVPYYSMDRTYKALPNLYNMMVDLLLVGHRHTPSNLADQVIMNGSMMGGNPLSVNDMKVATRAGQDIFYFDLHHGINRKSTLHLEDRPRLTPDVNRILTPYTAG